MKYFLVGIKGAGMSALAVCLKNMGNMVIGSDKEDYYFTEENLNSNKIPIFKFNKNNINKYNSYTYIISYAYNEENNEEVAEIIKKGYKYLYYSDFINEYFKKIKIGISGTHGKTTVTTMVTNFFIEDDISYIIGDGNGKGSKTYKYLIFEACEYKYHFINYDYDYLVINNIDFDHPDFYNNIEEIIKAFKMVSKKTKCLIVNNDDINARKIKHYCRYTYGIKNKSFVTATILTENEKGYKIKISVKNKEYYFTLPIYGIHMVYNFLAAFTTYYLTHENKNIENKINDIMRVYKNPKRRIEEIKLENNNIIIDDYAHHPKEIESSYNYLKQKYSDYNISIVFQPHTYSRSLFLSKEFMNCFENKNVYIMDTFTSRETYDKQKEKVINDLFINQIKYDFIKIKNILEQQEKQVVIFMGAGDINNEIDKLLKCL